jgi:hypothetical protein
VVHISYEARVAGPLAYRWMYVFERYVSYTSYSIMHFFLLFSKPYFPKYIGCFMRLVRKFKIKRVLKV